MKDLRYFDPHRRATWLELFLDLIFVVALSDAGKILSEAQGGLTCCPTPRRCSP